MALEELSGGLNRLPEAAALGLEMSDPGGNFPLVSKVNCLALFRANPGSPKEKEAAVGLASASLASSPWPTRNPEKLPRVSPPASLDGCGSTRSAAPKGLSPEALDADEDAVEATDSSITWPNSGFPFPKENLLGSFTVKMCKKAVLGTTDTCRPSLDAKTSPVFFFLPCDIPAPCGTKLKLVDLQIKMPILDNFSLFNMLRTEGKAFKIDAP